MQQKILRLLFQKAGDTLNANAISRLLKVSPPAVTKSLPALVAQGLIVCNKDKESGRLSIGLNKDDHQVIWLKRADNLKQLYESGLVQFFYDSYPEATVALFGSYAFGEDTAGSDIDIAIFGAKEKKIDLETYEIRLSRPIRINYYKSLQGLNPHLRNNILNGITLKGSLAL
ncbi:MAG: nucleotidyltransferase domain-containing protein [Nanoarchaeota archaeon]